MTTTMIFGKYHLQINKIYHQDNGKQLALVRKRCYILWIRCPTAVNGCQQIICFTETVLRPFNGASVRHCVDGRRTRKTSTQSSANKRNDASAPPPASDPPPSLSVCLSGGVVSQTGGRSSREWRAPRRARRLLRHLSPFIDDPPSVTVQVASAIVTPVIHYMRRLINKPSCMLPQQFANNKIARIVL